MDTLSSQPVTFPVARDKGSRWKASPSWPSGATMRRSTATSRRKTGDPDRAEDLAQEVFADATAALSGGDFVPDSMLAWLYTIAQRRFADEARRRRRSLADPAGTSLSTSCPRLMDGGDDGARFARRSRGSRPASGG